MSSFKLRKKTEYAIMMMANLAASSQLVSIDQLQTIGLPRSLMVLIARQLMKAKLITAKEGRRGGYSLARPAETITLRDIVGAIEGPVVMTACLVHEAAPCPLLAHCPHLSMMGRLTGEINLLLSRYTLQDLTLPSK